MSSSRQRDTKHQTKKQTTHKHTQITPPRTASPVEDLQAAIGNQALGQLLNPQQPSTQIASSLPLSLSELSNSHTSPTSAVIQGKFRFQGLSDEISSTMSGASSPVSNILQKQVELTHKTDPIYTSPIQLKNSGSGQPLPPNVCEKMEQSFNTDFTNVRIHQGTQAKAIGALAFTQGNNIYFQNGQYNPQSVSGQALLGHELTHVVQQRAGLVSTGTQQGKLSINANPALEAEADRLGAKAANGQIAAVKGAGLGVQRQTDVVQQKPQETIVASASAKKEHKEETNEKQAGAGYITTTESLNQRSAKAEAAAKKIVNATDAEVKQAVEALAKAGVLGEVKGKAAIERGSLSASAEGSAKGSASAEANAKASATVKDIMEGITLLAEASASAKASSDLQGRLALAAGPLQAELLAKLHVAANVLAEAKGKFDLGLAKGLNAQASAKVSASVEASGEVSASVEAYEMVADLKAEGQAEASAKASAEGKLVINLQEVTASGKAEFFAGAKAKGSAGASLTYKGKVLAKLSVEAEASAGIGGTVKGEFSYKDGTVKLSGKLATTLGIGAGVDTAVEANPKEILKATGHVVKDAVKDKIVNKIKQKEIDRNDPTGERPSMPTKEKAKISKELYDSVFYDFESYGLKKDKSGKQGIKQEVVQDILDKKILLDKALSKYVLYQEADAILEKAAKDAFGSQLKAIKITAGNIKEFKPGSKNRIYPTINSLVAANAKQ